MKNSWPLLLVLVLFVEFSVPNSNLRSEDLGFDKLTLTEEFHSEGIAVADINRDGKNDIVSGPFWYMGPDYRKRFRYMKHVPSDPSSAADKALSIKGYSTHFFTWTHDFNRDGNDDILIVGMPGDAAYWFENPGKDLARNQNWIQRKAYDDISNESPAFTDITGDGKPEIVCLHKGTYSFIHFQEMNGKVTFTHTPISPKLGYGRFTHGLGVGDVDGDGRLDLLETNGWWQQKKRGELFKFHAYRFAQSGGAQMFAYDFDGDGDNDVICSQNAHRYGLKWFEQVRNGQKIDFIPRTIMANQAKDNPFGLAVSQMHAAALADMDGDGIKDLVTGKRFWAHGGGDPGSKELPLLFWLKTIRKGERVIFEPKLVDVRSGVGTQVTVADINGDKKLDIAVGSKLGSYVFIQNPNSKASNWTEQPLRAGTKLFYENVRTTEPLTPEEQQKTFVLPQGFEIQLVAAEPDIAKPMNMAFDHRGRLWVSSSREYPFAAKPDAKHRDAIKILEDTNGDGRADKVKTYADGLNIPMGLLPYGDGVICFSIPNIWYLRDTDGDDKVDKREILYGPFDTTRDTHGMCSSFRLGNDGWIYACHGFNNQSKVKGRDGHEVVMQSGNTFRFRPDGSRIEIVGQGQVNPFGMTIDSYGDIFTADCHTKPINLVLPGGHHDSFGKPHDGLGYVPNVMEHLHDSTGIGGVVLGENTNFPVVYQRSSFGGNVVTGRINRNHLVYTGSSMRAREESDFVIPGDPWFRPVNLQIGPDGALYIADFYNRIIGHYEVDLNHPGRDRERGRIWKVVYRGDEGRRDQLVKPFAKPKKRSFSSDLIELQTANRSRAEGIVNYWVDASKDEQQLGLLLRVCAELDQERDTHGKERFWLSVAAHRCGQVFPQFVETMMKSKHARVRSLAQQFLCELPDSQIKSAELRELLAKGLKDTSPFVQRFAALSVAKKSNLDLTENLVELLKQAINTNDRYLIHSVKIALREQFKKDGKRLQDGLLKLRPRDHGHFADVCMAVKSPESAKFIVENLESLATENPAKLTPYLQFAARHANEKSIDSIVEIARKRFANDYKFQLAILDSLRVGIQQKQRPMPDSMKRLASDIAARLLRLPSKNWTVVKPGKTIAFTTRKLLIPLKGYVEFIDTLARGESATGTLRSAPFRLKKKFSFRIAGHDGQNVDVPKRNLVRIVLNETGKTIATVFVPGKDAPQAIEISTENFAGKEARFEIVDGSPRKAYGWIAVGEFKTHPQLNPATGWTVDPEYDALAWICHPSEDSKTQSGENIFVLSTQRRSADGMKETPLWSSIVKGERKTGVYRSETFELPGNFRFYLAGHDGFPDKPHQKKNYVQLRLASSGQVIKKTLPPRNDTAQPINWDTNNWSGQKAYVEIVDQDSANAFAWLAAGRFSVPGLNPTQKSGDRILASQIISRFRLKNLGSDVIRLIGITKSSSLKSALCKTWLNLSTPKPASRAFLNVAAELVAFAKTNEKASQKAITAIKNLDAELAKELATDLLKIMTVAEQTRFADILSMDKVGSKFVIESIDRGLIAVNVLSRPALVDKLRGHRLKDVDGRLEKMIGQIPRIDPLVLRLIESRKKLFQSRKVNIANGKLIYEKNCASCHQLRGKGKQVGPNLDGIGSRGLERLVDDILLPNRNVDAAFRASLISTVDGRLISGLVKKQADDTKSISVVDKEGKEVLIARSDIEDRKETKTSPMPANFGETISANDFVDLINYLLSNQK